MKIIETTAPLAALTQHDRLIEATVRILSAYGFSIKHNVRGRSNSIAGDSGTLYFPDILASRGPWNLIAEARTRSQRGTGDKINKPAVQLMVAEISDLQKALNRPHGMLITPHGTENTAQKVADHFGVIIGKIPFTVVDKILALDFYSQREDIIDIARRLGLVF